MATALLHNGRIIDGSGTPSYDGSVFVEDELIRDVIPSNDPVPEADTVIDAAGLAITPGFIDMHSHADWILPAEDHSIILKCMVEQGVTSIVGGNCGFSPAPINTKAITLLKPALDLIMAKPFEFNWNSMGEFFESVQMTKPMLNMAELVGHASIFAATADTRHTKST
jgi:N-acyl-D-aspartate/D-glutamate deacylase